MRIHCMLLLMALAHTPTLAQNSETEAPSALEILSTQAASLRPWVETDVARAFLDAVSDLPTIETRSVYHDRTNRRGLTVSEAEGLSGEALEGYELKEFDQQYYYNTRYGSPLAFSRPLDLLGEAGLATLDGARIIDFGYGKIGQLRLMASIGATAVGIEVNEFLKALYSEPMDTGFIPRAAAAGDGEPGTLRLVFGQFPGDEGIVDEVGVGFDAFVSKNTLKNGYIHPAEEVDPRMLVHLGVDDATFVQSVYNLLNPGGLFLIYNLCPPQSEERYIPWADGTCPFDHALLEKVGFEVIAYDVNDDEPAREMAQRLGWAESMNLETDLFGVYTLLRRK